MTVSLECVSEFFGRARMALGQFSQDGLCNESEMIVLFHVEELPC